MIFSLRKIKKGWSDSKKLLDDFFYPYTHVAGCAVKYDALSDLVTDDYLLCTGCGCGVNYWCPLLHEQATPSEVVLLNLILESGVD